MTAREFLEARIKTYEFGDPFGLNRLPCILYDEVAKTMQEYADSVNNSNERNSVDEATKSFACCNDCGKLSICYAEKKCWLKEQFAK